MKKLLFFAGLLLTFNTAANAQIAQGGNYRLEQSVIASGGGEASGGNFSLAGTLGQPIAGISSDNTSINIYSGFFTPQFLAPTAASVSITGKILTPEGSGLKNARVVLTDMQGNTQSTNSTSFGYYNFPEAEAGQTYILTVISKRYQFAPRVITVIEDIEDLDFVAQSQNLREQKSAVEQ